MKKFFTFVAVVCMAASAMAQNFVSHESDGGWSINLLGLSAFNGDNSTRIDFSLHRDFTDYGTPGFYFGISNMANPSDDLNLKPGNSLEFGFTAVDFAWWNNNRKFGIISGLGISWTRYGFKNNEAIVEYNEAIFESLGGNYFGTISLPKEYSKPRMTYASWRLPIELAFSSHRCLFTAGVEGELRHHLRMRTKYGNDKKHYVTSHEMGVNPFGVNAVASIGCKGMSLYGRVALTEFFNNKETDLEGTPFMVGIRFYTHY